MATQIYKVGTVELIDGRVLELKPLKIKYLREFMEAFENVKDSYNDEIALTFVSDCVRICMKQFCPDIDSIFAVEDSFDIRGMYKVMEFAAGVTMNPDNENTVKQANEDDEANSWETLDLVKLESEAFLLGIWKDYEDIETSLSMPELVAILETKRENEYSDKKFAAAMQGVDLDEQTGRKEEDPWEAMKARVFSGGKTEDSNSILAYQGANAAKAGFGIGMGLGYEDLRQN